MSSTDPAYIAGPIAGAITSVLAVAQAVPFIDKRLARVAEVESQIGRLPNVVEWLYVRVQQLHKYLFVAVAAGGAFGLLAFLFPGIFSWRAFSSLGQNGIVLAMIWLVLGLIMYTNILPWCFIGIALGVGRLDPTGKFLTRRHPAWHALCAFAGQNENAKPLVINERSAVAFADCVVSMLREAEPEDRAAAPRRPGQLGPSTFRSQLGNALLAGCVIEEAYWDLGLKPVPKWGAFYSAIGEVVSETEVFSTHSVSADAKTSVIGSKILQELNARLTARRHPTVPGSPELTNRLNETYKTLVELFQGDASSIDSNRAWFKNRRLEAAYKRLGKLPTLKSDSMRAQFIKLAVVWNVWTDVPLSAFRFPFALRVAAVLLDRNVIRAPQDVKVLAFEHPRERQVAEAAERLVVAHAIRLIEAGRSEHERWLPVPSRDLTGEPFRWWVTYELDVRLWSYASRLHKEPGESAVLTRWKSEGGRAVRL